MRTDDQTEKLAENQKLTNAMQTDAQTPCRQTDSEKKADRQRNSETYRLPS
jgi:hypothetical protein